MFGIPKVLKPLCLFLGYTSNRLGYPSHRSGYPSHRSLTCGDFFQILLSTGAKHRSVFPHVWHSESTLTSMTFLGLNLARLGLSLAQFGLSLAQVTYLRRLLPNHSFNRSKAKYSLFSCLAFRKFLNHYDRFLVKGSVIPLTCRVIPRTGQVIPRTDHLLSENSSK